LAGCRVWVWGLREGTRKGAKPFIFTDMLCVWRQTHQGASPIALFLFFR
jgi:hypothetical protein